MHPSHRGHKFWRCALMGNSRMRSGRIHPNVGCIATGFIGLPRRVRRRRPLPHVVPPMDPEMHATGISTALALPEDAVSVVVLGTGLDVSDKLQELKLGNRCRSYGANHPSCSKDSWHICAPRVFSRVAAGSTAYTSLRALLAGVTRSIGTITRNCCRTPQNGIQFVTSIRGA